MIKISVIIPIYNSARHISRCLDDLISQSEKNIEIICVNDGSTDDTACILENYRKIDTRIKVFSQKNKGAGAARNLGLQHANGRYTLFLDCDDAFELDMLSEMADVAEKWNADVVLCRADSFSDITGEKVPTEWTMPVELLRGKLVFSPLEIKDRIFQIVQGWPWDKLFRTEHLREIGVFYPDLPNSHDLVFVFQALIYSKKIALADSIMVHRRVHNSGSISNSREKAWSAPYEAVISVIEAFEARGIMQDYKQSFYPWVLEFWNWHLSTLPMPAQKECYNAMKKEWFARIRFGQLSADNYPSHLYRKYRLIRLLPYWAYNSLRKIKKRIERWCKSGADRQS